MESLESLAIRMLVVWVCACGLGWALSMKIIDWKFPAPSKGCGEEKK